MPLLTILVFIIAAVLFPPLLFVVPILILAGLWQGMSGSIKDLSEASREKKRAEEREVKRLKRQEVEHQASADLLKVLNKLIAAGIPVSDLQEVFITQWNIRFYVQDNRVKIDPGLLPLVHQKMPSIRRFFDAHEYR